MGYTGLVGVYRLSQTLIRSKYARTSRSCYPGSRKFELGLSLITRKARFICKGVCLTQIKIEI